MREPPFISADSHVVEPADLWSTWLDKAFRDRAPSLVMPPKGTKGLYVLCDGLEPRLMSSAFASGVHAEALLASHEHTTLEEGRAGGWDPAPRLVDMALEEVEAEVLSTSVGFGRLGLLDSPVQIALWRADNAWLAACCAYAPTRLAGLGMIPLLDGDAGCQKRRHRAKLG